MYEYELWSSRRIVGERFYLPVFLVTEDSLMPTMSGLSLEFLGGFRLSQGSKGEIAIPGKKAQALLAYLALNAEQRHRRDKLATLLWGDRLDEQARQSLRQSLSALRKALGCQRANIHLAE